MRRTVKDKAALEALALKRGARVDAPDGKVFNAKKAVIPPRPKSKPAPEPAVVSQPAPTPQPKAVPKGPSLHEAQLKAQMLDVARRLQINESIANDILRQIAEQTAALNKQQKPQEKKAPVPTGWTFEFERDTDGYIERIIANPRRLH